MVERRSHVPARLRRPRRREDRERSRVDRPSHINALGRNPQTATHALASGCRTPPRFVGADAQVGPPTRPLNALVSTLGSTMSAWVIERGFQMIERIDEVTDLGLFTQYKHGADCEFKDVTLVFGENGVGKTTIAALLDSVRSGSAEPMLRRARLGATRSPTAKVTIDAQTHQFDGSTWDSRPPTTLLTYSSRSSCRATCIPERRSTQITAGSSASLP